MIPAYRPGQASSRGSCWSNPGGPGGSGLSLAAEVAQRLSPSVARDYDNHRLRPARRRVRRLPKLSCGPVLLLRPRARTTSRPAPTAEQVNINRAKTYAHDCEQKFGWLLPYMTSAKRSAPRPGLHPRRVRRGEDQTISRSPTAPISGQVVRDAVSRSASDGWCWTAPSIPTGVWYTDNVGPGLRLPGPDETRSTPGWPGTTAPTNLGSTAAQVRDPPGTGPRNQLAGPTRPTR